jgi:hypothetical protein
LEIFQYGVNTPRTATLLQAGLDRRRSVLGRVTGARIVDLRFHRSTQPSGQREGGAIVKTKEGEANG